MKTALGWTNGNGWVSERSDVCCWFLFSGNIMDQLKTCTKFYIDLAGTLEDENEKNWKYDYKLTMKLAYTTFHMRSVFSRYIKTEYGGAKLNKIISQSIKDGKLYISTDIPYVLFLMLLTIIRYAGERNKRLHLYEAVIKELGLTGKLDKAATFLIIENFIPLNSTLLDSRDDGHSVASYRKKSTSTIINNFVGLNKRILKVIKKNGTIRLNNLKASVRNGQPLHSLIIPTINAYECVDKNYLSLADGINIVDGTTALDKACGFIKPLIGELHA